MITTTRQRFMRRSPASDLRPLSTDTSSCPGTRILPAADALTRRVRARPARFCATSPTWDPKHQAQFIASSFVWSRSICPATFGPLPRHVSRETRGSGLAHRVSRSRSHITPVSTVFSGSARARWPSHRQAPEPKEPVRRDRRGRFGSAPGSARFCPRGPCSPVGHCRAGGAHAPIGRSHSALLPRSASYRQDGGADAALRIPLSLV